MVKDRINVLSVQANRQETDRLQRVVARLVATSPPGVNLLLIGEFRYRLLDNSQRFSVDIAYMQSHRAPAPPARSPGSSVWHKRLAGRR